MGLSFLHPWALAFLPLAAAPWLLHRWASSKARTVPFPSLDLLRAALRASFASSVLSHRLLLVLRTLLMLALLLLLGRPVLRWGAGGGAGGNPSVIVAVDVSASMGARTAGRTRLDWAVEQALAFRPSDGEKAGLLAFSDRAELSLPPTSDGALFEKTLRSLRATARPTNVEAGLAAAAALLEAVPPEGRALVLLTDAAKTGWRGVADVLPPQTRVVVGRAPLLASNAAVTGVRASGGGGARLQAASWGLLEGPKGWALTWEGRPAAQGRMDLGAGTAAALLPPVQAPALSRGEAALDPDGFSADDAYFLLPPPESAVNVLAVDGAPSLSPTEGETYFLSPVLEGLAKAGGRYKVVPPQAMGSESLEGWNVVVLLNGELSPGAAARVRSFVEKGGGFWAAAGDRFKAGDLGPLLPAEPTGAVLEGGRAVFPPEAARHPLGARLSEEGGFEWSRFEAGKFLDVVPKEGSSVILSAAPSGRPLLAAGRYGRGRTAFLTTSVDRDWGNLPSRPFFPVLCRELWSFLAGGSDGSEASLSVDQPWEGALPAEAGDWIVERPDGSLEPPDRRGGHFRYDKTDLPGFYTLRASREGPALRRAAVNLDRSSGESDPSPLTSSQAAALLGGRDIGWVEAPGSVRARFDERVKGRPLAGPLAALALLFFSFETVALGAMRR